MCQVTDVAPDPAVLGRGNGVDTIGGLREVTTDGDALLWRTERQGEHARGVARRNRGVGRGPGQSEVVGTEDAGCATSGAEVRRVAGRHEAVSAGGEAELRRRLWHA